MRKVFLIVKEDGKRVDGLYFYQIKNCLSSKKESIANNNSVNIYDFVLKDAAKNFSLLYIIDFNGFVL